MNVPGGVGGGLCWLEINLDAIQHNFAVARRVVTLGVGCVKIFPVIKADGYGLGAVPIARRLTAVGADGFCVARVEEADLLRCAGIDLPIILLSGLSAGVEPAVVALKLWPFVFDVDALWRLDRVAGERPVSLFLKVDTGMHRLGLAMAEVAAVVAQARALPRLHLAGLVSHLACADVPDHPENIRQWHCFQAALTQSGMVGGASSLANSAALLARADTHFAWVRPGIMLYGASPFFPATVGRDIGLRPVVRWCARILQVSELPVGAAVGYSQTFTVQRSSRIALVAVGYADGYNRLFGNGGVVLVAGCRVPVVGRVSMDMIAVDVTDLPSVTVGQLVTLLGQDGDAHIDVEEMATWRGTIPYEVLCNLGQRVPRFYVS